jgi:hypothetical protein
VHHVLWPDVRDDHVREGVDWQDGTYLAADLLAESVEVSDSQAHFLERRRRPEKVLQRKTASLASVFF